MLVKELIEELKKCNPDDIVLYSMEHALENNNLTLVNNTGETESEEDFGVEDVLIGGGTLRGFVFLVEALLE